MMCSLNKYTLTDSLAGMDTAWPGMPMQLKLLAGIGRAKLKVSGSFHYWQGWDRAYLRVELKSTVINTKHHKHCTLESCIFGL